MPCHAGPHGESTQRFGQEAERSKGDSKLKPKPLLGFLQAGQGRAA